ncbi:M14 family zinc carboxypeptidase [Paenibacillus ginsengarvi]|uniref:M14 family zinc carboxypeptidase n=1 Tax=Paenibacillus ginsengarvi TaxID=400777 RepID=UPI001315514D|nr:M14 family zinc carboxypeptidase [Paenibacillus ginsengarvi]
MRTKGKIGMLLLVLAVVLGAVSIANPDPAEGADSAVANKAIIDPYQMYTYPLMMQDLERLAAAYPDLIELQSIGQTVFGRDIRAVKLGKGDAAILVDGAQHAREWMGTNLILYLIDRYAYAYEHDVNYGDYNVRDILDRCTIWFVPMVNPDGTALQQEGLEAFPEFWHANLLGMNGNSSNFKHWKANAQGVDINRQYPAMWADIRNSPGYPKFKNFKGWEPAQTAEAASMMKLTYEIDPEIAFSYHSSGRVLYWHFNTSSEHVNRDKRLANAISAMTGYGQVKPEKNPSGGGFTDWFIMQFGRPGFTAELGTYQEENELPLWTFGELWEENKEVPLYLAAEGYRLWLERYPIEQMEEQIQLLGEVQLYNRPSESSPVGATLKDAKLKANARLGQWYRVSTWLGPKWIRPEPSAYLIGHTEPYEQRVKLTDKTPIYASPKADVKLPLAELHSQEVEAIERWNDWIRIKTWLGSSWIKKE